MNTTKHFVIIHGAYGNPDENWFPWLKSKLEDMGYTVSVPKFPTPEGQSLSNWLDAFERQVGRMDENMVLIGHSLGPGFILNLLEHSSTSISAAFLVSGFTGELGLSDFDPINETFVCKKFDWKKIRHNAKSIYVYNSDNDPYVPITKGEELAHNLDVELHVIHNGGHINASAGFGEIPFLLEDIVTYLNNQG